MITARVTGNVTAAVSHPGLKGVRVMICEQIDAAGAGTGQIIGAADWTGAGIGSVVLVDSDGDLAKAHGIDPKTPLRNIIAAIVDKTVTGGGV